LIKLYKRIPYVSRKSPVIVLQKLDEPEFADDIITLFFELMPVSVSSSVL